MVSTTLVDEKKKPEAAALFQSISTRSPLGIYSKERTRSPLLSHETEAYRSLSSGPDILWQPGHWQGKELIRVSLMDNR